MPFSDLSDDILLEIALFFEQADHWCSFAALNSRCRAAALSVRLAIEKRPVKISDHSDSTIKALKKPTKELMNTIRKVKVTNGAIIETANEPAFGLDHLRNLILGSKMLDKLSFGGDFFTEFPLIAILNLFASLQTQSGRLPDNRIRALRLWEISCFEDCSNISPMGLAGLEILHIYWQKWSLTDESNRRKSSTTTCEVLGKMIKAASHTLQSLQIDLTGDMQAMRKFDIRMLAGDEGDMGAWKKLRKLRVEIDVDSSSPLSDCVGTLEAIADMFPNLETLELVTDAWRFKYMVLSRF
ncbi:hypothetical protein K435DRAFT_413102 [Dendrothele bispora CBS 962.96]|uniref:F-box domain-containing protein n=1 Tax=Dendrothele bispora (strain CBS 962.96) TaxID=1314807 RepID=A0A4S8MF15_DENBC|nr:hypothetical protein K435DRAFT_413102 [Dendrothele bispora CBS 962.96]